MKAAADILCERKILALWMHLLKRSTHNVIIILIIFLFYTYLLLLRSIAEGNTVHLTPFLYIYVKFQSPGTGTWQILKNNVVPVACVKIIVTASRYSTRNPDISSVQNHHRVLDLNCVQHSF